MSTEILFCPHEVNITLYDAISGKGVTNYFNHICTHGADVNIDTKFNQLVLREITEIVATRCQILRLQESRAAARKPRDAASVLFR